MEEETVTPDSATTTPDTASAEEDMTEEMALLKELTESVSESLKELTEVHEEIEETPYLDKDGLPKKSKLTLKAPKEPVQAKGYAVGQVIEEISEEFKAGDSLSYMSDLFMREYFLVRVNPEGVITNVRDERTMTNANTRVLRPDQLKGCFLVDSADAFALQIVPVGLNVSLKRHKYPVKLKNGKVKPLKAGFTEDDLEVDSEHYSLILANAEVQSLKGKYVVEVVEGDHYLSIHDQFEYNPFGVTLEEIDRTELLEIVSVQERF